MTARQIIEARLCRPLGPIVTMPKDLARQVLLTELNLRNVSAPPISKPEDRGFAPTRKPRLP